MAFVESYYGLLPEDVDSAWNLLSPQLQEEVGSDSYYGYWRTIDDVQVDETRPAGKDGVEVDLTYSHDGITEQETRLLEVGRTDDGYELTQDHGPV